MENVRKSQTEITAKEYNTCTKEPNRGAYQQTGLLFGGLQEESTFTVTHIVGGTQFHATQYLLHLSWDCQPGVSRSFQRSPSFLGS